MDPWPLAYLAGHRDMNITKRYVHPQEQTIHAAMDRASIARRGHTSGHTAEKQNDEAQTKRTAPLRGRDLEGISGAPGQIRTADLLVRSQTLYPTELRAQQTTV